MTERARGRHMRTYTYRWWWLGPARAFYPAGPRTIATTVLQRAIGPSSQFRPRTVHVAGDNITRNGSAYAVLFAPELAFPVHFSVIARPVKQYDATLTQRDAGRGVNLTIRRQFVILRHVASYCEPAFRHHARPRSFCGLSRYKHQNSYQVNHRLHR